jgi:hypothetical protein
MAKTYHKNGGGVFTSGRKRAWEPKMATKHPPTPQKNRREPGKKACKSGRRENNHGNVKRQLIYAMKIKSNGKSRFNER